MKNQTNLFVLILLGIILFASCNSHNEQTEVKDSIALNIPEVRKGAFYGTDLNASNAVVLADSISYDVTIKNPDPSDEWTEQDIGKMNELALANIIMNAVYNGRLTAYRYIEETPMTIEEVKELESRYPRDKVARMRFVEEWYFDEKEMKFGKKVNSIMIAYEHFNDVGEVRYFPGVMVYLNDKSKNPPQKDLQ